MISDKPLERCSECLKEFIPTKYGWGIPCPHCCELINILPDPQFFVYVDGKAIGIAIVKGNEEAFFALIAKSISKILTFIKPLNK